MVVSVSVFFFSSRRRHTRCSRDWSSDVCSSDLVATDYLRGPQGCSDLTVFPANPNLDISGRAFSQKTLHEFLSLNRIDPEANVQGTSANHFVVAPPGQVLVRFVDFDIAMILQPRNGDG